MNLVTALNNSRQRKNENLKAIIADMKKKFKLNRN
jgi:hypothetical protein